MHSASSTSRTIGTHSSSRVVVAAAGVPPPRGSPGAVGADPRASMPATEPGAIVDSLTSNRSTAKRTGASGSTGAGDDGPASVVGRGEAGRALGDDAPAAIRGVAT